MTTNTDAVPLKPCPFCGSADICMGDGAVAHRPTFYTFCQGCSAGTQGHPSREASDAAWNRRSPTPSEQAEAVRVPTNAEIDVLAERSRQVIAEGWTPKHDDAHDGGQMAIAAGAYALQDAKQPADAYSFGRNGMPSFWPWHFTWWKPSTTRHNLVKAAALILAEIERIDRAASSAGDQGGKS